MGQFDGELATLPNSIVGECRLAAFVEARFDIPPAPFDAIVAELRALKSAAGDPSYGELVKRVMRQRVARGMSEWEARVGRTTVYDAFQPGRRVLDADLVGELVRALGGSAEDVDRWVARCHAARWLVSSGGRASAQDALAKTPAYAEHEPGHGSAVRPALATHVKTLIVVACIALNMGGRVLVDVTHMPLYLDMVGTAITAIIVGPWAGVGVGVATSLVGAAYSGWISVPFAPVEAVGALIWGYGVRRFKFGRTVPRFFLLNVLVAVACSVVAVPVIVWLDHGVTGSGADQITRTIKLAWHSLLASVAAQNIMTSLVDKLISGFIALGVAEAMPASLTERRERLQLRSAWLLLTGCGVRNPLGRRHPSGRTPGFPAR